jgi:hypothetical protein
MSANDSDDLIVGGLVGGASWLVDVYTDTASSRARHSKSQAPPDGAAERRPKPDLAASKPWSCPSCGASNSGRAEFCSLCAKLRPASIRE